MGRPTDWTPLAETDPVPGEPEEISRESKRLAEMAAEMRSQIQRLQAIGNDDTLVGQYADTLRTAATDLAGRLEKTDGRYHEVSGELRAWGPELEHAQDLSVRALHRAKEAEAQRASALAAMPETPPGGPPPTTAEMAAQRHAQAALDEAARDLAMARRQLEEAVEFAQTHGKRHAERIRAATEDEIDDTLWSDFQDVVRDNADWIKEALKWIGRVGLALSVIALCFTGVGTIAVLAAGATAVSLLGHTALAASEKGSWTAVGLDVLALATFGAGKFAARGLRIARAMTRSAAAGGARSAARSGVLRRTFANRNVARSVLSSRTTTAAQRSQARTYLDETWAAVRREGDRAAREVIEEPLPTVTRKKVWKAGDNPAAARDYEDIIRLRNMFPGDEAVQHASRHAEAWRATSYGAYTSDLAVTGGNAAKEIIEDVTERNSHFTKQRGSQW